MGATLLQFSKKRWLSSALLSCLICVSISAEAQRQFSIPEVRERIEKLNGEDKKEQALNYVAGLWQENYEGRKLTRKALLLLIEKARQEQVVSRHLQNLDKTDDNWRALFRASNRHRDLAYADYDKILVGVVDVFRKNSKEHELLLKEYAYFRLARGPFKEAELLFETYDQLMLEKYGAQSSKYLSHKLDRLRLRKPSLADLPRTISEMPSTIQTLSERAGPQSSKTFLAIQTYAELVAYALEKGIPVGSQTIQDVSISLWERYRSIRPFKKKERNRPLAALARIAMATNDFTFFDENVAEALGDKDAANLTTAYPKTDLEKSLEESLKKDPSNSGRIVFSYEATFAVSETGLPIEVELSDLTAEAARPYVIEQLKRTRLIPAIQGGRRVVSRRVRSTVTTSFYTYAPDSPEGSE